MSDRYSSNAGVLCKVCGDRGSILKTLRIFIKNLNS